MLHPRRPDLAATATAALALIGEAPVCGPPSRGPRRRAVPLILSGVAVLFATPVLGQATAPDFYRHQGVAVDVRIHLDSLGIWAETMTDPAEVQVAVSGLGLTYARDLPERIFLFSLPQEVTQDSLTALARRVEIALGMGKAGPLARLVDVPSTPWVLTDELLLRFEAGATQAQIDSLNGVHDVQVVSVSSIQPPHWVVQVQPTDDVLEVARAYIDSPLVRSSYPNLLGGAVPTGTPARSWPAADPYIKEQWHLDNSNDADIDAPEAWALEVGDPSIVIAVIELTGVDPDHEDLVPNLWVNPGEADDGVDNDGNGSVDDINGCLIGHPTSCDLTAKRDYHGTAVAGLAAAKGDNGIGVKGVCPECGLMLLTTHKPTVDNKVHAFKYARAMKASVINASWYMARYTELENIIAEVAADNPGLPGIPVVSVMSNQDIDWCDGDWLADMEEVFAVGASSDGDMRLPTGRGKCIDALAPGGAGTELWGITTTDSPGNVGYNTGFESFLDPWPDLAHKQSDCTFTAGELSDRAYTRCFGGTSASAPITAGITALMLSRNSDLTRTELYQKLRDTAEKIDESNCAYVSGFSEKCGWGRVNAHAALQTVEEDPVTPNGTSASPSGTEIGVRIGWTFMSNSVDRTVYGAPTGGPLGVPVIHVANLTPPWIVEGQVGFRGENNSGSGKDTFETVLAIQPALFVSDWYVGPNAALWFRRIGTTTKISWGGGGALGNRWLLGASISLRLEGRYRYWTNPTDHELGLALAAGVIL